jgi:hypothetical protein
MNQILGNGRDDTGVNRPVRVGSTGIINGTGTHASAVPGLPSRLLWGRTANGVNVPLSVETTGIVRIA